MANAHPVFLGPSNPGAESGLAQWRCGAMGGGSVSIDNDDPATGDSEFKLANAASGPRKHADLRSDMFSLGPAGEPRGPLTISFAYKLPDKVKPGDNIALYVQFFDQSPTHINLLGEKKILVGSSTGDSAMTQYKTMTITNILAPANAVVADIWIVANVDEPWISGVAQFDDFSVTAAAPQARATIFAALAALLIGTLYVRQGRKHPLPMARCLSGSFSTGTSRR